MQTNFEFEFTDRHFTDISSLVTKKTGIELPLHKKNLVYARLVRRLRELKLTSFDSYLDHVKTNLNTELEPLVNAITTNVTSFFREPHHFDHLLTTALPDLQEKFGAIKLWCAAASTGEEPYTLAITAKEYKGAKPLQLSIIASDLDSAALAKGQKGQYTIDPDTLKKHPLLKQFSDETSTPNLRQMNSSLQSMLRFQQINLMDPTWPISGPVHVVFCRNCVIYFSKDTQRKLFARIAELMPSGGYLYLGHSESLLNVSTAFNNVSRTVYQKI